MSALRRTKLGNISINNCKKIDNIILSDIICVKDLLSDFKQVTVNDNLKKDILNGKILDNLYGNEKVVFLDSDSKVLAVYKPYEKDTGKIKPDVMLGGVL
jgi:tRNA U55 pseudouridine synthase TruB